MNVNLTVSHWMNWILKSWAKQSRPRRQRSISSPAIVEHLERRQLLSVITVTTTTDTSNDGNTSSISALLAHPGSDGKISLREAILAANNTGGSNTITFDPHLTAHGPITISPIQVGEVTADDSAFAITSDLTIIGANDRSLITLRGTGTAGDLRLFRILAGGNLNLQGLTMTNWSSDTNGGGVAIDPRGQLEITNSTLTNNSALAQGGAIFDASGGTTLTNTTLSGNRAHDGGAYDGGGLTYPAGGGGGPFTDCLFVGNSAIDRGGAIAVNLMAIEVVECTFSDNSAHQGGAIAGGFASSGPPNFSDSTFIGNTAVDGGAIYSGFGNGSSDGPIVQVGAPGGIVILEISNCTFTGNSSLHRGGGIYAFCSTVGISNCTLTGNHAQQGGGIYEDESGLSCIAPDHVGAVLAVGGTEFSANSAVSTGGAIYVNGGTTSVSACKLINNVAQEGGALFNNYGWADVTKSVVLQNYSTQGTQLFNHLGTVPITDSMIGDIAQMRFLSTKDSTGAKYAATNPGLEPTAVAPHPGTAIVTGADGIRYALTRDQILLRKLPGCNWSIFDDLVLSFQIAPTGDCYWLNGHGDLMWSQAGNSGEIIGQDAQSFAVDKNGTAYDLSNGAGPGNFAMYRSLTSPLIDPIEVNDDTLSINPPTTAQVLQAAGLAGSAIQTPIAVIEPIVNSIGPPLDYPNVGLAQMHYCVYKCTVYYNTILNGSCIGVIYVNENHLHRYVLGQTDPTSIATEGNSAIPATSIMSAVSDTNRNDNILSIWTGADGTIFKLGGDYNGQHLVGEPPLPLVLWKLPPGGNWQPLFRVYSAVVTPDNTLYALNANHELLRLLPRSSTWSTLATNIQSFARTANGALYALNHSGTLLRMLPGTQRLSAFVTGVKSFAVTADGSLYELNGQNQLKRFAPNSTWSVIDAGVKSFVHSATGTLYELNGRYQLKSLGGIGHWSILASSIVNFTADQDGTVYALNSQHELSRSTPGGHWSLVAVDVQLFVVAPNALRDVYILTMHHELQRLEASYSWSTLRTGIVSLSIDTTGVVTAVDAHHKSWMYWSPFTVPDLDPVGGATIFCENPPTRSDVLSLLHIADGPNVKVVLIDPTEDTFDPPRWYANLGDLTPSELHHCHYECTVQYTTAKGVQTVVIDINLDEMIRIFF